MIRQRPTVLQVIGFVGLGLGLLYMLWLLVGHYSVMLSLLTAGIGDTLAVNRLRSLNLASPLAVYATIVSFFLELALTGILIWAASGLITVKPSARWAAVFYSIFMIPVGMINVILAVFVLKPPSGVNVLAVLARGVIVLFAVILWGAMFMPAVKVAYGEDVTPPSMEEVPFEEEYEEEQPAPSSRRTKAH